MRQDPELVSQPEGAMIYEKCVVCGHACHHGEVCSVRDCNCGNCYHEIEEVDDYLNTEG